MSTYDRVVAEGRVLVYLHTSGSEENLQRNVDFDSLGYEILNILELFELVLGFNVVRVSCYMLEISRSIKYLRHILKMAQNINIERYIPTIMRAISPPRGVIPFRSPIPKTEVST